MSGGGLGQVIQAVIDDPESFDHDCIVVLGGTNDMKEQNFPSVKHFADNVDKSLEKLVVAASEAPEKRFCLVQQTPVREMEEEEEESETFAPEEELIRREYLHAKMEEVASKVINIETTKVEYTVDETGHPTDEGTHELLTELNGRYKKTLPLIWNPTYIVATRPYSRVESIYRYGCNGCHTFGLQRTSETHNNQLLCDECMDAILSIQEENVLLQRITEKVCLTKQTDFDNAFPGGKRKFSNDAEDTSDEATKYKGVEK